MPKVGVHVTPNPTQSHHTTNGDGVKEKIHEARKTAFADAKTSRTPLEELADITAQVIRESSQYPFPIHVFPEFIQSYILEWTTSIFCSWDMLAIPLLSVAGAAIGRSGRRLQVKDGREESSCLWTICLANSGIGKTPALKAVQNFYNDKQEELWNTWEKTGKKGPYPAYLLTDTTGEFMPVAMRAGPVLFSRDELTSWTQQMGQYKKGAGGERADWCSFWSHSQVHIGRKMSEKILVPNPFVAVTGMMVPTSAHYLNSNGNEHDGFVHRMLIGCPDPTPMQDSLIGVKKHIEDIYKKKMSLLFDPPQHHLLNVSFEALLVVNRWLNEWIYPSSECGPDWLRARYSKFSTNVWRVALVIHELRRIADTQEERIAPALSCEKPPVFDDIVVDVEDAWRAITVINYFKDHVNKAQEFMALDPAEDATDNLCQRFLTKSGESRRVSTTEIIRGSKFDTKEKAFRLFLEWQGKGYGTVVKGRRKDQTLFEFK